MSRASLYRALDVYLQYLTMDKDVRDKLNRSQHYELTQLPDNSLAKDEIARDAVDNAMSVREVAAEVKLARGAPAPRASTGVKASLPPIAEAVRLLAPWEGNLQAMARPAPAEAAALRVELDRLDALSAELRRWLR